MNIKLMQNVPWRQGTLLFSGHEYNLPNSDCVRLCNESKAKPSGVVPASVALLLNTSGDDDTPKPRRRRR